MRSRLPVALALAVAAALFATPVASAAPGGVFITGHDPDFHVLGGNAPGARNIIRRSVEFVTSTAPGDPQPSMLVVSSRIAPPSGHRDSVLGMQAAGGFTFDVAAAPGQGVLDLNVVDFAAYEVVVVASDFGGILRQAELDILNARAQDLIDFVNAGGGLVAFAEGNSGSHLTPAGGHFDFLPFVASEVPVDQNEDGNTVTAFGASLGLTNADVNGNASHTVFAQAGGFEIVDVDDASPPRILSLAVRGKKICPGGVPEARVFDDPSHPEGNTGVTPFAFRVRLSIAPCGAPATVDYATAHGTAGGADYEGESGTLTFQDGETEKSVVVDARGDVDFEPDETFLLNLTGATGAAIADGQGIGTILNDDPQNRPPNCATAIAAPRVLWPPNHRFHAVAVSGATDPDGDAVAIAVSGVTQDEPVDGSGDGASAPDARNGDRPSAVELRAERSGSGDGRVYRIAFSGTDGNGGSCTGSAIVGVPHDRRRGAEAIDSGGSYDSFGG
jgi:hypothetical protein